MIKSPNPTNYIVIRAYTISQSSKSEVVIQHLTEEWKEIMRTRLMAANGFRNDKSFLHLTYWDTPTGYFVLPETSEYHLDQLFDIGRSWSFVELSPNELDILKSHEVLLDSYILNINFDGGAHYTAVEKYNDEEHFSDVISLSEVLA